MKQNHKAPQAPSPYSDCPQDVELESFLLSSYYGLARDPKIARHLEHCSTCRDKVEQMRAFYDILNLELSHPAPPEVLSLGEKIQMH